MPLFLLEQTCKVTTACQPFYSSKQKKVKELLKEETRMTQTAVKKNIKYYQAKLSTLSVNSELSSNSSKLVK